MLLRLRIVEFQRAKTGASHKEESYINQILDFLGIFVLQPSLSSNFEVHDEGQLTPKMSKISGLLATVKSQYIENAREKFKLAIQGNGFGPTFFE